MLKLIFKYTKEYKKQAIVTPFLMVIEICFDTAIPYVMSLIIDKGINGEAGPDVSYIYQMGWVMVGLSLLAMVCGCLASYTASKASAGFIKNLRIAMFEKVNEFSFGNIEKFEVPSMVTRMTKDMREIRMAYNAIVRSLFRAPLQLIFGAIMAYLLNPDLAVVFWMALPVLIIGLLVILYLAHPRFKKLMWKFDAMNASLEENFIAIRVVKTFVREKFEKEKFEKTSSDVVHWQRHAENVVLFNSPLFNLTMYACMIAVCWMGGNFVVDGRMTNGEFTAYLSYLKSTLFAILMLSSIIMQIVFAQASIDRANEILNEVPKISDEGNDPNLTMKDGSVEFKDVAFAYTESAEKYALSDVNLKIESGQTIGIIGPTGSAKSSLVQLIPRLYDTTEGEVIVSGHNVKEYTLANLRKEIAMVLQKNELFSGTIEENLKWGDLNATHEEVVEACKAAQADDFISSFPEGYNTYLGQGGVNVSGGQKQRLCIARALLKKPKIIILDDSTSAVDTDTDKRIRTALKEKLSGMTTIIIAQRISSVMDADQIIVMDDGRITDVGTHEELMQRNEVYADLYKTQSSGVGE